MAQLANLRAAHAPGVDRSTTGGELVIGRGIQVKGQIGACKTLVVEGELDASVEVQSLLLREGHSARPSSLRSPSASSRPDR